MRRTIKAVAILAMAVSMTTATAAAAPAATTPVYGDATTYLLNAQHTGLASGTALPRTLKAKWSHDFTGSVSYPVIAGSRLFVTVSHNGPYGTDLYAFDARTGAQLWGPIDLGGTYYSSQLAYSGGHVFTVNFDGQMQSFDAATGTAAWTTQLPGQYAFTSPVTPYNGVLYTGGAGSGGTLYAVDAATGAVKWTGGVANGDSSGPAVDATGVYTSYACEVAYRYSLTGRNVWTHTTDCSGGGGSTPALYQNKLWIRDWTGKAPALLSTATGKDVGTFASQAPPAFTGNRGFELADGTLTAINTKTGATLWSTTGDGQLVSAPVISGNRVYVGSGSGAVLAFNIRSGQQVWSGSAGAPVSPWSEGGAAANQAALAIGGGVLAVPAGNRLAVFA